jgi:ribosomal protein S18 acetylase RimI-like enzyme
MRLRRAESTDIEPMATLLRSCYDEMTYLPKLHTPEEDLHFVRETVFPHQEVWVADDDGRLVGFAALTQDQLAHIYVDRQARDRGVGSALFRQAMARRPDGFTLWTFQANEGARRFYERHGCRVVQLTSGEGNEEKTPDVQFEWRPPG